MVELNDNYLRFKKQNHDKFIEEMERYYWNPERDMRDTSYEKYMALSDEEKKQYLVHIPESKSDHLLDAMHYSMVVKPKQMKKRNKGIEIGLIVVAFILFAIAVDFPWYIVLTPIWALCNWFFWTFIKHLFRNFRNEQIARKEKEEESKKAQ